MEYSFPLELQLLHHGKCSSVNFASLTTFNGEAEQKGGPENQHLKSPWTPIRRFWQTNCWSDALESDKQVAQAKNREKHSIKDFNQS